MIRKVIRVHRKNSAFVYAILESLEGMTSYSTLGGPEGSSTRPQGYCDLELWISPGFASEIDRVLEGFRQKFPVIEIGA